MHYNVEHKFQFRFYVEKKKWKEQGQKGIVKRNTSNNFCKRDEKKKETESNIIPTKYTTKISYN